MHPGPDARLPGGGGAEGVLLPRRRHGDRPARRAAGGVHTLLHPAQPPPDHRQEHLGGPGPAARRALHLPAERRGGAPGSTPPLRRDPDLPEGVRVVRPDRARRCPAAAGGPAPAQGLRPAGASLHGPRSPARPDLPRAPPDPVGGGDRPPRRQDVRPVHALSRCHPPGTLGTLAVGDGLGHHRRGAGPRRPPRPPGGAGWIGDAVAVPGRDPPAVDRLRREVARDRSGGIVSFGNPRLPRRSSSASCWPRACSGSTASSNAGPRSSRPASSPSGSTRWLR